MSLMRSPTFTPRARAPRVMRMLLDLARRGQREVDEPAQRRAQPRAARLGAAELAAGPQLADQALVARFLEGHAELDLTDALGRDLLGGDPGGRPGVRGGADGDGAGEDERSGECQCASHAPTLTADQRQRESVVALAADGLDRRRAHARLGGQRVEERPHALDRRVGSPASATAPPRITLSATISVPGRERRSAWRRYSALLRLSASMNIEVERAVERGQRLERRARRSPRRDRRAPRGRGRRDRGRSRA